jgi:hypothetical protein
LIRPKGTAQCEENSAKQWKTMENNEKQWKTMENIGYRWL